MFIYELKDLIKKYGYDEASNIDATQLAFHLHSTVLSLTNLRLGMGTGVVPEEKAFLKSVMQDDELTNGDIVDEIAPMANHASAQRYSPEQAEKIMLAKIGAGLVAGDDDPTPGDIDPTC